ncbi:MAG: PEP-CTERM sorting domain-containing protein [Verrucomicrobia bacterium]|nr:PEP-CTERM sorting domain-containing protein [Verrucomicrobiota bacterium]MCH8512790.1 PEP-CTERM sorting domain-containing protein [Kiritimatiellia bacterium]
MKMNKKLIFAAFTAAALPFAAQALTIGFETGEDYAAGNLANNSRWSVTNPGNPANANPINVTAGVGVGGTQGLSSSAGSGSNFTYYGFDTTNADLGFTFDSESSILDYSFQWRATDDFAAASVDIFRFTIGSSGAAGASAALSLTVRSHGVFVVLDGATTRTESNLFTSGTYATISGQVNYATNTYTVFVDDTQQFTAFNGGSLAFNNANSDNAFIRIGNLTGQSDDYVAWNLDNITVIPEPSTLALLGIALSSMMFLRRRKN